MSPRLPRYGAKTEFRCTILINKHTCQPCFCQRQKARTVFIISTEALTFDRSSLDAAWLDPPSKRRSYNKEFTHDPERQSVHASVVYTTQIFDAPRSYTRDVQEYVCFGVWPYARALSIYGARHTFFVDDLTEAWNPRHGEMEAESRSENARINGLHPDLVGLLANEGLTGYGADVSMRITVPIHASTHNCVEVYFAIPIVPEITVGVGIRIASAKALPPSSFVIHVPCTPSAATFSDNGES
ncbi:hypothetical protein V8E53_003821 [Lactarius tabidus]